MQKKFKVIALSCGSDFKQTIYKSGDIVTAADFHEGHAEKLVEEGFLKEMTEEEMAAEQAATCTNTDGAEEIKHKLTAEDLERNPSLADEGLKEGDEITLPKEGFIASLEEFYGAKTLEEFYGAKTLEEFYGAKTLEELQAICTEQKIEFKPKAKKEALISLLIEASKKA